MKRSTPANLPSIAVFLFFSFGLGTLASGHSPVDFLEVIKVEPGLPIEHTVELKTKLDHQRTATPLEGPQLFARAVGAMNRPLKKERAYLHWFKISEPAKQEQRELTVLDMVRGSESKHLSVREAEYLLAPSQLIGSGAPQPIPDGLDLYKAYRIVDAPAIDREITLTGLGGPRRRRLGKPIYVCVAAEQWHHDEYINATHPNDCFVVYELDPQDRSEVFNTIDQFGLNELRASSSTWLCARAALLRSN